MNGSATAKGATVKKVLTTTLPARAQVLVAACTATWLAVSLPVSGQAPAKKPVPPQTASSVPRTPYGSPSMRGVWFNVGGGLNEANGPRALFVEDCRAAF